MDYPMSQAGSLSDIEFRYQEVPTPANPLSIKGAGEAGTVGSMPAYVNTLINALTPLGIEHIDMPATSFRVWETLNSRCLKRTGWRDYTTRHQTSELVSQTNVNRTPRQRNEVLQRRSMLSDFLVEQVRGTGKNIQIRIRERITQAKIQ